MVTAVVLVVVVTIMLSVKYSRTITLIVKEMGAVIKDLIMEG